MSITKDFEDRETEAEGRPCYYPSDVTELLTHARALEAMLRKLQYSAEGNDMGYRFKICPECSLSPGEGHKPSCEIGKLLEGVE